MELLTHGRGRSVSYEAVLERRQSTDKFGKFLIDRRLKNCFLAALPSRTFYSLLPYLELVRLSAAERLYDAGDEIDFVYFPETAIVSEFRILESGDIAEIAMTGKEGGVGLLSLCSSPAVNWMRVLIPGSAYRIKSEILKNRMAIDPAFQSSILHYLTNYIDQISTRTVCKKFHPLEQRICVWLLMIQDRQDTAKLPLTHEQIGFSLGVQRPCVGNAASRLKRKKIIAYARGRMIILNREGLMQSACGCYSEITG